MRHTGFALVLLLASSADALEPALALSQYRAKCWTRSDGAPIDMFHAYRGSTSDGYSWFVQEIGGRLALTSFDGAQFKARSHDPQLDWTFTSVFVDQLGRLIVVASEGVYMLQDGKLELLFHTRVPVFAAAEAKGQGYWIKTAGAVELWQDGVVLRSITIANEFDAALLNTAQGILEDHLGRVWVWNVGREYLSIEHGKLQQHQMPERFSTVDIREHRDGGVWVSGIPILRIDQEGKRTPMAFGAWASIIDRDGVFWMASGERGFFRARTSHAGVETDELAMAGEMTNIWEDGQGAVWGAGTQAMCQLTAPRFLRPLGAPPQATTAVLPVGNGEELWLGTSAGIVHYEEGGHQEAFASISINLKDGKRPKQLQTAVPADIVNQVSPAKDGQGVWLAFDNMPPCKAYAGKCTPIKGYKGAGLWALVEASQGTLWMSRWQKGLEVLSGGKSKDYNDATGHWSTVSQLLDDGAGGVWLATPFGLGHGDEGGLSLVFPLNGTSTVARANNGDMWLGTSSGGIYRYAEGSSARTYGFQKLFGDAYVVGLVDDGAGTLWVRTSNGVARVPIADFDAAVGSLPPRIPIYNEIDGLPSNEVHQLNGRPVHPVIATDSTGRIWVSSDRGPSYTYPSRVIQTLPPPRAVMEEIVADGVVLGPSEGVPVSTRSLEVRYTAPASQQADGLTFAYRLDRNEDWVEVGKRRVAYLGAIRAGAHCVEVRATNHDGLVGPIARRCFVKPPAFVETGWFIASCVVATLLVSLGVFALRLRQLRRNSEKELERQVLERDIQLGATVQAMFLPRQPDIEAGHMRLVGSYRPASSCGGDWWYYEQDAAGNLILMIGDVTGHGVPSAMITAAISAGVSLIDADIPRRLGLINSYLLNVCGGRYAMSMLAMLVEPSGKVSYWTAGAPPFLHFNGKRTTSVAAKGGLLGSPGYTLGQGEMRLAPHDRILVFTDGVTELGMPNGKQYGPRRLARHFGATTQLALNDVRDSLNHDLDVARQALPLSDDVTFVILEYAPAAAANDLVSESLSA